MTKTILVDSVFWRSDSRPANKRAPLEAAAEAGWQGDRAVDDLSGDRRSGLGSEGEVAIAAASDAPKAGGSVRLPAWEGEERKLVSAPQPVAPGEGAQAWESTEDGDSARPPNWGAEDRKSVSVPHSLPPGAMAQ